MIGVPSKQGFRAYADHKVFYDLKKLKETLGVFHFTESKHFYSPFKFKYFEDNLNAYCLYALFCKRLKD